MIYGLLWLAMAAYLLFMRRREPSTTLKFDLALAGVALGAITWFCHLAGFDLGLTTRALEWATLALVPLLIGWIALRELRSFHSTHAPERHFWSGAAFPIILIGAFALAPTLPAQGGIVAIIGVAIFLLSLIIGPRRKA